MKVLLIILITLNTAVALAQQTDSTVLNQITITPNPYYQIDHTLKYTPDSVLIDHLPSSTKQIDIYSLNGTLVKSFKIIEPTSAICWNLCNYKNVPICTGIYLIHIQTPDIGDKILKFYALINPTVSTF